VPGNAPVEDEKLPVAGKESYTYDDGLAISIGNIKRAKVPEYNDHPGAPMVKFDVRITNNPPYKLDSGMGTVMLSYGPDGREVRRSTSRRMGTSPAPSPRVGRRLGPMASRYRPST
jgi:hypothetical protein